MVDREPTLPCAETMSYEQQLSSLLYAASGARNMIPLLVAPTDTFYPSDIEAVIEDSFGLNYEGLSLSANLVASQLKTLSGVPGVLNSHDNGGNKYFEFTHFGLEICRPFAANVAALAHEFDIAPLDLVGTRSKAHSESGLPARISRLRIYNSLLEGGVGLYRTVNDLSEATDINTRVLHNHLPSLLRAGIVAAHTDGTRVNYPIYGLADPTAETPSNIGELIATTSWSERKKRLCEWVVANTPNFPELRVGALVEKIVQDGLPTEFFRSKQKHKQAESVAEVLDFLFSNHWLKEVEPGSFRMTAISLTEPGHTLITRYLRLIDYFLTTDGPQTPPETLVDTGAVANEAEFIKWLYIVDGKKGATTPQKFANERDPAVIKSLSEAPHTTAEIMAVTGLKRRAAHNLMQRLKRSGVVEESRLGRDSLWKLCQGKDKLPALAKLPADPNALY